MNRFLVILRIVGIAFIATSASASFIAFDSASDPAYSGGWTNGSNGGYGFGPWVLTHPFPSIAFGIGPSTENDDGVDDGVLWGLANDGDIGNAFRLRGVDQTATAGRRFLHGPLTVGQTFSIEFDNGWQNEALYAIRLYETDSSFNPINLSFEVFLQLSAFYERGPGDTWLQHGTEGVRLDFTITGTVDYGSYTNYAYSATLTRRDGVASNVTGEVSYLPNYVQAANLVPFGGNPVREGFYINRMSIVPEPASVAFIALGAAVIGFARRKNFHRM
ncbi:MAG: PEP-CTERM sorting domain-containing protein [Kiritimatiellae bacterium]|nr:PEP-CTERM sorting domain-containing protein [Kiritimatiellia bacterium]MDW8459294.1 PEP-CTERM sorting domain-containing protein [Verrucomicrobiota bacterium]